MPIGLFVYLQQGQLPFTEIIITLSCLVLGGIIAVPKHLPLSIATLLVGVLSTVHGYSHGAAIVHGAQWLNYGIGLTISTVCLQIIGLLIARYTETLLQNSAVRWLGAGIMLIGSYNLINILLIA